MSLEPKLLACVLVAPLAACQAPPAKSALFGTSVAAISTIPPLQTSGTASYKFLFTDVDGTSDPDYDLTLAISGTVDTRTLRYNLFGNAVTSIVNADGRQPDTDGEQQGFARVFATLPPTGTAPQLGASWTIGLPSALEARLTAQTADDTSSTRPTFSGQITGLVDLDDPSDFAIVRATISVKRWATRPPSIPGPIGPQPGLVSVGVADLAVGTGPTFTGIVPLRAAYFGQPGVTMPDGIDWRVVAAGPHTTDLYCLTADDAGVPASVIAAIPDIVDAPYPAAFDSCTH